MTMIKYRPFSSESDVPFRFLEDTMNQFFSQPQDAVRPWAPSVDVFENENEVVLKADLPGVEQKDIEVKLENGTLTLKGERQFAHDEASKGYRRIERSYGAFTRYFTLPETVNPENVKAEHKNGVLTVTLPKKEIAKPKTIQVSVS